MVRGEATQSAVGSVEVAEVERAVARLRAGGAVLSERDPRQIASSLSELAEMWLSRSSSWMARAVDEISADGPFSRPMLEEGLRRMVEPLRGDAIAELIQRELGGWQRLAQTATPKLALHILPSNLPGHAAIASALTLVLRCAVLLKPGRADRVFTRLWLESMRALDADLGACVDAAYWRGGRGDIEDIVLSRVDLVVVSGGDRAVETVRSRCRPGVRFIGHGNKVSFAVVSQGAARAAAAGALARDVAIWDQLGCLSPQVCFVEGKLEAARRFAGLIASELRTLAVILPPGRMSGGEVLEVRRFRDAAAWRGYGGGDERLFVAGDEPGSGSVAVEECAGFTPTPLYRCLRVVPYTSIDDVVSAIAPHRAVLEGAGVAAPSSSRSRIRQQLNAAGVPHVVELGSLQLPTLEWRQGGRPRIADWCGDVPSSSRPSDGPETRSRS